MGIRQADNELAETRAIVEAIRELQTNPRLLEMARVDTPAVLDHLRLSSSARHAVAAALALSISGVALVPGTPIYWT